jgi:hypothetical protein
MTKTSSATWIFTVVVETNGLNYDFALIASSLNDSLLGPCVYTDQSKPTTPHSSIKVEADDSYTTTVSLTIPGSTEHDTYLSDRTISLTKILFRGTPSTGHSRPTFLTTPPPS